MVFIIYGIDLPVTITTMHMTCPRLNVDYPLVATNNIAVSNVINGQIQNLVNKLITDEKYSEKPQVQIMGSYEIKTNEKGILSLVIITEVYTGGIHSLRIAKALTFDVQTGRLYSLKDLFKPGADYVKVLSEEVLKQVEERKLYLLGKFIGIRPDQDFYIADKSLVIYFQTYEITSYAFGIPYFPISIYDLKDIIDEKGPLQKMLY